MLAMSSVILAQEVHPAVGIATAALTVLGGGITFACTRYANCPLRRIHGSPRCCQRRPDPEYPHGYHGFRRFRKEYDFGW